MLQSQLIHSNWYDQFYIAIMKYLRKDNLIKKRNLFNACSILLQKTKRGAYTESS